jgi:hypothetical protein
MELPPIATEGHEMKAPHSLVALKTRNDAAILIGPGTQEPQVSKARPGPPTSDADQGRDAVHPARQGTGRARDQRVIDELVSR